MKKPNRQSEFGRGSGRGYKRGGGRSEEPRSRGKHRGGRGGGGRLFGHGDLRLLVLQNLSAEATHGYGLIKVIQDATAGAYAPSPGVLYPTLALLEDQDLIVAAQEGSKKIFSITDKGREELEQQRDYVNALQEKLQEKLTDQGDESQVAIRGAMHRLRSRLKGRILVDAISDGQVQQIVTILEKAADDIDALLSPKETGDE